jgi:glycosyltransferase involved in cell wall biosynthesis
MKISICIPQYNRISFLLKNLSLIEQQSYEKLEVVVSDDCSTDNTMEEIHKLISKYKYPLLYHRFETNHGYDKNLRKSIELATGEYVVVLGNDDTINPQYDLLKLTEFLQAQNYPEIGFANFQEEDGVLFERAKETKVIGSGRDIALRYYSCFSFVGGLIFKRDCFMKYNTNRHDGSIYAQIYLASYIIALGNRLFSIKETVVIKDLIVDEIKRDSYRDKIATTWKQYRKVDGGLPSVIHVVIEAMQDAGVYNKKVGYRIFKKIYFTTLPFWIIDYKSNGAFPEAIGIIHGLYPPGIKDFSRLNIFGKIKICLLYAGSCLSALVFPVFVYKRVKGVLYNAVKR